MVYHQRAKEDSSTVGPVLQNNDGMYEQRETLVC